MTAFAGSPFYSSSALAPALSAFRGAIVSLTQPSFYHMKRQDWEMHAQRTDCVFPLLLTKEGRLNKLPSANEWAKQFPECLECLRCLHCLGYLDPTGCQGRSCRAQSVWSAWSVRCAWAFPRVLHLKGLQMTQSLHKLKSVQSVWKPLGALAVSMAGWEALGAHAAKSGVVSQRSLMCWDT